MLQSLYPALMPIRRMTNIQFTHSILGDLGEPNADSHSECNSDIDLAKLKLLTVQGELRA